MFNIFNIIFWVKKTFNRKNILLIFILLLFFFISRLINLDKFPIFSDEGIYIHWAKVAWHDASWRFISLTDGKQPLQTWGIIPFLKLFPDNALLAGRLFSVATGFTALAGMFSLLFYLWGKKAAFIGSFIYVFTPYFLFYDKMALVDSGVNAGFIWILFLSILLVRTQRLDTALIFGLTAGLSLLAKSSVRIFLALSAFAPTLLIEKNKKKFFLTSLNYYTLFIFVILISLVLYNIQRLSPFFHYVAEKNKTFVMTPSEFLQAPFSVFFHNIKIVPEYVTNETGFILIAFAILGLWNLTKKNRKLGFYFLLWILVPFAAIAFFSKVIFPRYLIFFASLLIIYATYYFSNINRKFLSFISYLLLIIFFSYYNYTLLFDYAKIPFPEIDRGQYIEGKTAAWGAKDIVEYVRKEQKPSIILAEGNFGLVGDVLDVFTKRGDKIFIKGYWPLSEKELYENQSELAKNSVYVVFSHRKEFPENWPIRLVKKYDKPGGKEALYLFELLR